MATIPIREFHREGLTGRLWCLGQACWFDVESPAAVPDLPGALRLEVLQQARTASGWPVGLPRRLFEDTFSFDPAGGGQTRFARLSFPFRLAPELLDTCHFRVTPVKNEGVGVSTERLLP